MEANICVVALCFVLASSALPNRLTLQLGEASELIMKHVVIRSGKNSVWYNPRSDIWIDVVAFRDPAKDRNLICHSGRHGVIQYRLQKHQCWPELLRLLHGRLREELRHKRLVIVDLVCRAGRHRSVGTAELVTSLLQLEPGVAVQMQHLVPLVCACDQCTPCFPNLLDDTVNLWHSLGQVVPPTGAC